MRQSVFHSAAMVVFMLLVLNANLSAETATRSTASNWAVISHPARLVNGSPVLFRVTTPKPVSALSGNWLGHDIEFSFDAGHKMWFALAGVSLETKPGIYPLQLHGETSDGTPSEQAISFEKNIRVENQRYPRVLLKVPGRYTAPSPDDQREKKPAPDAAKEQERQPPEPDHER